MKTKNLLFVNTQRGFINFPQNTKLMKQTNLILSRFAQHSNVIRKPTSIPQTPSKSAINQYPARVYRDLDRCYRSIIYARAAEEKDTRDRFNFSQKRHHHHHHHDHYVFQGKLNFRLIRTSRGIKSPRTPSLPPHLTWKYA